MKTTNEIQKFEKKVIMLQSNIKFVCNFVKKTNVT